MKINSTNYKEQITLDKAAEEDPGLVLCLDCTSSNCLHVQLAKNYTKPYKVVESIVKHFPNDYNKILKELKYDSLNGCYYFTYAGMYVGVEEDGYIHT